MSRIVLTDGTTPANVSSGQTQVYTKSGGPPGTEGLYYKQGADPEVGPIGAGGGGGDLQTAYDAGNKIVIDPLNGPVEIEDLGLVSALKVSKLPSSAGPGIDVSVNSNSIALSISSSSVTQPAIQSVMTGATGLGADVIYAEVQNSASIGNAIQAATASLNSSATAIKAVVGGIGSAAKGLVVEVQNAGSTGDGIYVAQIGTGDGIEVQHTGAAGNGVSVAMTNGATTAHAIVANHGASGANLHLIRSGTGNLISTSPATFNVDNTGNTTTPSVIFGGSRITVEGDSGVAGEPLNPRMSLTSGGAYRGALSRVYHLYSKASGAPGNFDLNSASELPTVVSLSSYSGWTVNLPNASKYKNGEEIVVLNLDSAGSFDVVSAVGRLLENVAGTNVSPITISGGAGRRLMALVAASSDVAEDGASTWVVTGVI